MIITVTPNPSVDRTIEVADLLRGKVHRATSTRMGPGGRRSSRITCTTRRG